jgi:hypothetical protein
LRAEQKHLQDGTGHLHFSWLLAPADFQLLKGGNSKSYDDVGHKDDDGDTVAYDDDDHQWENKLEGGRIRGDTRREVEVRHRFSAFASPVPWTAVVKRDYALHWEIYSPALAIEIRADQGPEEDDGELSRRNELGKLDGRALISLRVTDTTTGEELVDRCERECKQSRVILP